ncbi:MAG: citrate synthase [Spirochaetes bacterium]|nr:citrate synthase [Spirochaetota bacterium]
MAATAKGDTAKRETATGETATIILEGKSYELPVVRGTEGEKAVDISGLRKASGFVTLDRGYENTGSCRSAITFIDGERGILRYRGYPIEDLAEHSTFTEVAYLLLYGELPTAGQLEEFSTFLNESSLIHEDMLHFFVGFPRGSHPMGILATTVASLSTFYPIPDQLDGKAERQILANLISQVRTIAAISYKKSIGEPIVYPSYRLRYVPNFLTMMFSSPVKDYRIDEDIVRAIDLFFILHADHEQNCSTSTVRMTGSSLANVYAVISAGISALWGPRHGGANQAVITMLQQILAEGGDGTEFIRRAKDRNTTDRLMGFGHRVYKSYDPRASILKRHCHKLLNRPGMTDPLFDIAQRLEEIALKDDYFLSRNLYPNVDFYSGLILRAAGIPYDMFTVLFAIGRTPGWLAHWREMYHGEDFRIARPRQIYTGPGARAWVERSKRG